ncbi:RNA polymerase sigma factor [bacterium]|nr:RNA polymerase sigma factor [bacterium]
MNSALDQRTNIPGLTAPRCLTGDKPAALCKTWQEKLNGDFAESRKTGFGVGNPVFSTRRAVKHPLFSKYRRKWPGRPIRKGSPIVYARGERQGENGSIDRRPSVRNWSGTNSPESGTGEIGRTLRDLFTEHQDEILGTLYHLLGSADDARDAYQEAFLKSWAKRAELDKVDSLKAWVFRVAINTARDMRQSAYRRRRQGLSESIEAELVDNRTAPAEQMAMDEELNQIRQAIGQLSPSEKEVFLLRENGELTFEEIAHQIGIPVGTVKTRMRSALANLRRSLTPYEGETPPS